MVGEYLNGNERIRLFSVGVWLKGFLPVLMALGNHIKNTPATLLSDKVAIPLPFLRKHIPTGYKADCIMDEGQEMPYLPRWELIKAPEHTPDSVCFYKQNEAILISGDTILNMKGSGSGELNHFCCDRNAIKESLKKLAPLAIKKVYPGHGNPLCNINGLGNVAQ